MRILSKKITLFLLILFLVPQLTFSFGGIYTPSGTFQPDYSYSHSPVKMAFEAIKGAIGNQILEFSAWIGRIVLDLFSIILVIAGKVLDASIALSISDFHKFISMEGVKQGWTIMRDVSNMFFIFILLYIAIATILQMTNTKRMIATVIAIAILINFSGVLTKVVIDASNVFAYGFYRALYLSKEVQPRPTNISRPVSILTHGSLGQTIVRSMNLLNVQGFNYESSSAKLETIKLSQPEEVNQEKGKLTFFGIIAMTFGGIALILTTSFVFFFISILFMIRTVTLTFLYILSPLAMFALVVPNFQSYFGKWWHKLLNQAIFAPVLMLLILVSLRIMQATRGVVGGAANDTSAFVAGAGAGAVTTTFYFILMIGMLMGSVIIAKNLGAEGALAAQKMAGRLNRTSYNALKSTGKGLWRMGRYGVQRFGDRVDAAGKTNRQKMSDRIARNAVGRTLLNSADAFKNAWNSKPSRFVRTSGFGKNVEKIKDQAKTPALTLNDWIAKASGAGILGDMREDVKKDKEKRELENTENLLEKIGRAPQITDLTTASDAMLEASHEMSKQVKGIKDKYIPQMDNDTLTDASRYFDAGIFDKIFRAIDKGLSVTTEQRNIMRNNAERNLEEAKEYKRRLVAKHASPEKINEVEERVKIAIRNHEWMKKNVQF